MTVSDHAMTHYEHALMSYRYQERAETANKRGMDDLVENRMTMAQWHATMAVYELNLKNASIK